MLDVRCQVHGTLDAKGRLALPAALRKAMEAAGIGSLVLAFDGEAILAYDPVRFAERVEKPVADLDPFDRTVGDFLYGVLSTANDVEVDAQGRILVPPPLREMAGLDKEIVVVSMLDRLYVWDKKRFEERSRMAIARRAESPAMPRRAP